MSYDMLSTVVLNSIFAITQNANFNIQVRVLFTFQFSFVKLIIKTALNKEKLINRTVKKK